MPALCRCGGRWRRPSRWWRSVLAGAGWRVRSPVLRRRRLGRSSRRARHHPRAFGLRLLPLPAVEPIEIVVPARRHIAKVPVRALTTPRASRYLSACLQHRNAEHHRYWQSIRAEPVEVRVLCPSTCSGHKSLPPAARTERAPRCPLAPRRLRRAPRPRRTSHSTAASGSDGVVHGRC
jgi:hypothetical protein